MIEMEVALELPVSSFEIRDCYDELDQAEIDSKSVHGGEGVLATTAQPARKGLAASRRMCGMSANATS